MTWQNPPLLQPFIKKPGKVITPEMIAGKSEGSHQKAIFIWAAQNFTIYPQLKYLFHIPNGGTRNIREAVELKAQGVKSGIPDLMLPWNITSNKLTENASKDGYYYQHYNGLFIELKAGKNLPSDSQIEWIGYLRRAGYCAKVCYGWVEARDCIINYLEGRM